MRLLIVFIFSSLSTIGLSVNTDSLKQVISISENDTNKANALILLGDQYIRTNPDSALLLYYQGLDLAKSLEYKNGLAISNYSIAYALIGLRKRNESMPYLQTGLLYADSAGLFDLSTKFRMNLASNYQTFGMFDLAHQNYTKVLNSSEDTLTLVLVNINLAIMLSQQKDYTGADSLFSALSKRYISDLAPQYQVAFYKNYAVLKSQMIDYDQSEEYFFKALSISERTNNVVEKENMLFNLGHLYYDQGKYAESIDFIKKAMPFFVEIDDKYKVWKGHILLAQSYKYIDEKMLFQEHLGISRLYWDSIQHYGPDYELNASEEYAFIYEELGDFKEALSWLKKLSNVKDTIFDQRSRSQTSFMVSQLDLKEKAAQIKNLREEKQLESAERANERLVWIVVVTLLLSVAMVTFVIYKRYRSRQEFILEKERLENEKQKVLKEKEVLEMEQRLLLTQMNPHFIFNSLNSIKRFVENNEGEKAGEYLSQFARLMRLILESSRQEKIPIQDEIKILELYINLEHARFKGKFEFEILKSANFLDEMEDIKIPPMLIQPSVENAIEHGLSAVDYKGTLKVSFDLYEDDLRVTVEDNGQGRKNATRKDHESLGTKITEERIDGFNRDSGRKIQMRIDDLELGTKVDFTIPC
ncbi:MAG: tetratricopeptide repeat protein [Flavobacteriales bacterium]|nr:tetratricopeptide repeat protein [Flavobacteriales bacterium]